MSRRKRLLRRIGNRHSCVVEEEVTEYYFFKQVTPDGDVIRSDGRRLWFYRNLSWYGIPPKEHDETRDMIWEPWSRTFITEADYS